MNNSPATPRLNGLNYAEYALLRNEILSKERYVAGLVLVDAGQTNLYKTLAAKDPRRFGMINPSLEDKAQYRCHLGELFLDRLHLSRQDYKPKTLVSHGVRHSLSLIFKSIKQEGKYGLVLPADVYPVYLTLADESGLTYQTYHARTGLPWEYLEGNEGWCLLVCNPLKPWGGQITNDEWDRLVALAITQQGVVVVDGAYDLNLPSGLRHHLDEDAPVAFMGSLSKGWLSPLRGGVVVTNRQLADVWRMNFQKSAKEEGHLREAFAALNDHPGRPFTVDTVVNAARHKLIKLLNERGLSAHDPGHGYFVVINATAQEAWEKGVLAIPDTAFGQAQKESICIASALSLV